MTSRRRADAENQSWLGNGRYRDDVHLDELPVEGLRSRRHVGHDDRTAVGPLVGDDGSILGIGGERQGGPTIYAHGQRVIEREAVIDARRSGIQVEGLWR